MVTDGAKPALERSDVETATSAQKQRPETEIGPHGFNGQGNVTQGELAGLLEAVPPG